MKKDEMKLSTENQMEQNEEKNKCKQFCKELLIYTVTIFLGVFIIRNFVFEGVRVEGASMESTLQNNEKLIVEKFTTQFGTLERFDIIILDPHNGVDDYWIKRIIGLPGETIQIIGEDIFINGERLDEHYRKDQIGYAGMVEEAYTLEEDEYFVMGDNREISLDSREVGPIKKKDIEGVAVLRLWPLSEFGILEK